MRTSAREAAFKIIFASRFTGEIDINLLGQFVKPDKLDEDDCGYIKKVCRIISEHEEEFLAELDRLSHDFPECRIFPADKAIMLIAFAEIKYMDDVPDVVSVNEAANISSKYSSEKSASFISGILSEVIKG